MTGLAALRTSLALLCLPLFATACGGGSASSSAPLPGAQVPQQSLVASHAQQSSVATSRRPAGLRPAGCTPFPYYAPLLPPQCTIYVGGFISPTHGETASQQIASTYTFESQIGRRLAVNLHYYQWTDAFPGVGEADDANPMNNRIPLESWHCGDKDYNVASGLDDALLSKRAAALAAYGRPVFMRYKWEMNLLYNAKCADPDRDIINAHSSHYSPTEFIAAWSHIRSVFAANGATNVVWVFNPSSSGDDPVPYYPGNSIVDWVAFDHYDTNSETFYDTFFLGQQSHGSNKLWTYPYMSQAFPDQADPHRRNGHAAAEPADVHR